MEECALSAQAGNSCDNALQASVECIVALLESLQTLCSGTIDENLLNDQTVQNINNRFPTLKDVDYTGPLTYQYMARLPAPYRYFTNHSTKHFKGLKTVFSSFHGFVSQRCCSRIA